MNARPQRHAPSVGSERANARKLNDPPTEVQLPPYRTGSGGGDIILI